MTRNAALDASEDGEYRLLVIEGGARGADAICNLVAKSFELEVQSVLADWTRYGRGAGPIRNKAMLDLRPDYVLAFNDDLPSSRGTRNMVEQCLKAGLSVTLYNTHGDRKHLTDLGDI
jgi:hypothetical protein